MNIHDYFAKMNQQDEEARRYEFLKRCLQDLEPVIEGIFPYRAEREPQVGDLKWLYENCRGAFHYDRRGIVWFKVEDDMVDFIKYRSVGVES